MIEFGYNLTSGNRLDLDNIEKNSFNKLKELTPELQKCIACGSCTSSCSAGLFSIVSFRSSILMFERGMYNEAFNIIKGCMLCGKCTIVCPRSINIRDIIITISEIYKPV